MNMDKDKILQNLPFILAVVAIVISLVVSTSSSMGTNSKLAEQNMVLAKVQGDLDEAKKSLKDTKDSLGDVKEDVELVSATKAGDAVAVGINEYMETVRSLSEDADKPKEERVDATQTMDNMVAHMKKMSKQYFGTESYTEWYVGPKDSSWSFVSRYSFSSDDKQVPVTWLCQSEKGDVLYAYAVANYNPKEGVFADSSLKVYTTVDGQLHSLGTDSGTKNPLPKIDSAPESILDALDNMGLSEEEQKKMDEMDKSITEEEKNTNADAKWDLKKNSGGGQ